MTQSSNISISANTLFHFTDSFDKLQNIFINYFHPCYCLEDQSYLVSGHLSPYAAIPMVCFCDIPLSQINFHTQVYGSYCIGLTKKWGISNKINPVMYAIPESYSTSLLKNSFADLYPLNPKLLRYETEETNFAIRNVATMLYSFFTFLKPYEGEFWRDGQLVNKNVKFYDEREWRYVPPLNELNDRGLIPVMSKEQYYNNQERDLYNKQLKKFFSLKFSAADIKYIIVKNDSEIIKFAEQIDRLAARYTQEEKRLLITRLMSMEQIISDF
jgi:hypothetical protein